MIDPDLLAALTPVLQSLRDLGARHFVGGSIASSTHGIARSSVDADVVAELELIHVAPLVAALRDDYYVAFGRERWERLPQWATCAGASRPTSEFEAQRAAARYGRLTLVHTRFHSSTKTPTEAAQ